MTDGTGIWRQSARKHYMQRRRRHTPVDYVYFTEDGVSAPLSSYDVLIYAHPCILSEERVAMLEEFTEAGGILILGCRSGYKDMDNHCVTQNLPGLLQPLTGADIPEFTRTCPGDAPVMLHWGDKYFEAPVFHDLLQPLADTDQPAEVLAVYENCYYAGAGALMRHSYEKGTVYLLGTVFTEELAKALLEETGADFNTAFGLMHTIEKAAQIASIALAATGGKPLRQVITDDNLRDIGRDFGVTLNEQILSFKSDDELYC